jgi:serine/threonine-protein kinase RsbW
MAAKTPPLILATIPAKEFAGADREFEEILKHAKSNSLPRGLLFLSPPVNGASEVLKQIYDRLFIEQGNIVPIYFAISRFEQSRRAIARHFLHTFLLQLVAFRRNDAKLPGIQPDICEVSKLAPKRDAEWIEELILDCDKESELVDEESFIRQALSAPLRAAANGTRCFIIIDDLHIARELPERANFISDLYEINSTSPVRFVFGGRRRGVFSEAKFAGVGFYRERILEFARRSPENAGTLITKLSEKFRTEVRDHTIELLARQFSSCPLFLNFMFAGARQRRTPLNSFNSIEKIYSEELLGGRIGRFFDSLIDNVVTEKSSQQRLIAALFSILSLEDRRLEFGKFREQMELDEKHCAEILAKLNVAEVVSLVGDYIVFANENSLFEDYVSSRFHLENKNEPRAKVVAQTLATALKRAPETMARSYRSSAASGVRDILASFNCQELPLALFDYAAFQNTYKGLDDRKIFEEISNDNSRMPLPQIVFAASCFAFYPPIRHVIDEERCAVGVGFESGQYTNENEIAWIVAEIDSKLEASRAQTEFWCDRLEAVALMCNFLRSQIWLIAPEGFAEDARVVLNQRKAFGSSNKQLTLLTALLKLEKPPTKKIEADVFEMTVPMGDDTELIAAHTVEEIARRHDFKSAAINQIKTALVEACINAAEHSQSPDRKIYQRFAIAKDRLIITVANRGIALPMAKKKNESAETEDGNGRRGWGLKLIRLLMDEVNFEQVDDETRITMIKFLK